MMRSRDFFLILAFAAFIHSVMAHPHVFMDSHADILCDASGVQAIHVTLLYDEMYSQTRWETFDLHHTGKMDADEMAQLIKNEKEIFDHDGPFTWLKLDGQKIPTGKPGNFNVTMQGKLMLVSFTVPCRVPIQTTDRELRLSIYDPTFFYQISYQDPPISVTGNSKFSIECRIEENANETYYYGQMHPEEIILKMHPSTTSNFSLNTPSAAPQKHPEPIQWQDPPPDDEPSPTPPVPAPKISHVKTTSVSWLNRLALWQRDLKQKMTRMIDDARDSHSLAPVAWLLLLAFLYGIIHASGPGHGKVITVSYLLTNKPTLSSCLLFGNLIALFHGLSGIVLVLIAHFITRLENIDILSKSIGIISYGLAILIGIWLLWRIVKNKGCCIEELPTTTTSRTTVYVGKKTSPRTVWALAFSIGIIPCPGTMLIMLFCMAANVTGLGILLSLCETAGMATTISTIGILTMLGRKAFTPKEGNSTAFRLDYYFSIAGASLIILFSLFLLLSSMV